MAESMSEDKKIVIELRDVKRDFIVGDETVHALKGISFEVFDFSGLSLDYPASFCDILKLNGIFVSRYGYDVDVRLVIIINVNHCIR